MRRVGMSLLSALMLSGCSVSKADFDCPIPTTGVGCKSVSQIQALITENPEGEDVFARDASENGCVTCDTKPSYSSGFVSGKGEVILSKPAQVGRVWIEGSTTPSGLRLSDHYVYFYTSGPSWSVVGVGGGK